MRVPNVTRLILLSGLLATFESQVTARSVPRGQDGESSSLAIGLETILRPGTRPIVIRDQQGGASIRHDIAPDPSLKVKRDPMKGHPGGTQSKPGASPSAGSSRPGSSPASEWEPIPDTVTPGYGRGLAIESPIQASSVYEERGAKQMTMLETAISTRRPDTIIADSRFQLSVALQGQEQGERKAFLNCRKLIAYIVRDEDFSSYAWWDSRDGSDLARFPHKDLDFNPYTSKKVIETTVTGKQTRLVINKGAYDTHGGFIAVQEVFKAYDKAITKTPVNEMTFQNFLHAAGTNALRLKVIFINDIQNVEFWTIVRRSYNDVKKTFREQVTFHRGTRQFDRFMGSANIASLLHGLANHHNAVGHKIPHKIIIRPGQTGGHGTLNVAIVLKAAARGASTSAGGTSSSAGGSSSVDEGTGSKGGDKGHKGG